MKRSTVEKLSEVAWVQCVEGDPLEVGIVLSAANLVTRHLHGLGNDSTRAREICTRAFVNFRGFTEDDGTEVPNTIENRLWLWWNCPLVEAAVIAELLKVDERIREGEDVAASA
jgi:hypothetical protein